ncbi:MAG: putative bifunctional diguanylate cyclase/phosphodiesterase [Geminicoccales bacterium]
MAATVAAIIAITLPTNFYHSQHKYYYGLLDADVYHIAHRISEFAATNPSSWQARTNQLNEIIERLSNPGQEGRVQVMLFAGRKVIAGGQKDSQGFGGEWAEARASYPIYLSGRVIGRVEARISLQNVATYTLVIAMLAGTLGLAAFIILRRFPLRALKEALEEVNYLASHDQLTDLPNRTLFSDRLEQALAQAQRRDTRVAVICLDLDHFKDVNDTLGHSVGDELLQQVTGRLRHLLRKSDTLARLGGDEFAIVQTSAEHLVDAAGLAQRIIDAVAQPFLLNGHDVTIGSSVGITIYPDDHSSADHLLRNADLALYRAKSEGRGTYCFFEEDMNLELQRRKTLENDLRCALSEEQFELYYQPQIGLNDNQVAGVEALIRWHHPKHGVVSPDQFIPLVEETGLIIPITEWALRQACTQARDWSDLRVAVNLSPAAFKHQDLVGLVSCILDETELAPQRLEIEITETSLMQDTDRTLATLTGLKDLGVQIAMDDFGTGYSSLSYLQRFPFDKIKIDRSFIANLSYEEDKGAIIEAIIKMSQSLGMTTNVEGVETNDQASFLINQGCDEVQGFYYAHPMRAAEINAISRVSGNEMTATHVKATEQRAS